MDIDEETDMIRKMIAYFLQKEVKDWDDEDKMKARFKALSGQRCDWESLYLFWRDLIIKVARHLQIFILRPLHIKHLWFRRGGLSPLCLDRVLLEMYNAGDLLLVAHLPNPTTEGWQLSQLFRKAANLMGLSRASSPEESLTEDCYILNPLLKEKSLEVVKYFSENHWTPSCVTTMRKFQEICGGSKEASAILGYLSEQQKAKYLVIKKNDHIEGVKLCLDSGVVSSSTSIDYNVLHLIWTAEKLEQQLDLINQRHEKSRKSALASLKCGNKSAALRCAKELKLTSQSRDKCTNLLDRVEEVLRVIADAESSNKVSEAIQISTEALKDNLMSIEEVTQCLQDLDENIDSLKQVDNILGSNLASAEIAEEDLEDEFTKLELEIESQPSQNPIQVGKDESPGAAKVSAADANELSKALSNLNLTDSAPMESATRYPVKSSSKKSVSNHANLEPA